MCVVPGDWLVSLQAMGRLGRTYTRCNCEGGITDGFAHGQTKPSKTGSGSILRATGCDYMCMGMEIARGDIPVVCKGGSEQAKKTNDG